MGGITVVRGADRPAGQQHEERRPGRLPAGDGVGDADHAAVLDDNLFDDRQAQADPGIARADADR